MNYPQSHRRVGGFSLLEVLVASAVLAIVMSVLLGTLTTSLGLWRATEKKVSADREARAAELLLAQDLAGAVMSTNINFWPRLTNNALQLLTLKPLDYQTDAEADVGDVCFVEYSFLPDPRDAKGQILTRRFFGSAQTYEEVLTKGSFPAPVTTGVGDSAVRSPQILATNLLSRMTNAVRGARIERDGEMATDNVVVLGPDMTEIIPPYSATNVPRAVEINFAVADPDAIANADLLDSASFILRDAGVYSFRVKLPAPPIP